MTKSRKPSFEPSTVPVRNENFQAWLELVFDSAVNAGERQMKLGAEQKSTAKKLEEAKAALREATMAAARRRNGGAGEEA
jgi:hypothetical protein